MGCVVSQVCYYRCLCADLRARNSTTRSNAVSPLNRRVSSHKTENAATTAMTSEHHGRQPVGPQLGEREGTQRSSPTHYGIFGILLATSG